jgi:WS/DGAT/MGAT family acyltransferase
MQQLTAMDYSFVQMESKNTPMHISPVIIYDQSDLQNGPVRFKDILTVFERSLPKSAIFRRKLLAKTMGFDNPYWIEDPDFDLEFHVRHIALPKPGDWRQFCILISRLHARGLDMSRPLWEAYVIEGLNNVEGLPEHSFALMMKVHHAAIDGVSGVEIINAIHSLTPEPLPPELPDDWQGESPPPTAQLWSEAYINNLKRPGRFLEIMGELIPNAIRAQKLGQEQDEQPKGGVRTRFNGTISAYRVTDGIFIDLQEIKAIRSAVGDVTVNDVMVSIVGGGLRKYLEAKNELPQASMTCGAPISVRPKEQQKSAGNQVGMMSISLATDIEDPIERLKAVKQSAADSKAYSSALGASAMMDVSQSLSPQIIGLGLRAVFDTKLLSGIQMPLQTVVSNVPGPQFDLFLAGARVHTMAGLGPIMNNMGLFHAVLSGAGRICIQFVSCREMLPDPEFYVQCLQRAFAELKTSALKPAKKSPARKKRAVAKKAAARKRAPGKKAATGRRRGAGGGK